MGFFNRGAQYRTCLSLPPAFSWAPSPAGHAFMQVRFSVDTLPPSSQRQTFFTVDSDGSNRKVKPVRKGGHRSPRGYWAGRWRATSCSRQAGSLACGCGWGPHTHQASTQTFSSGQKDRKPVVRMSLGKPRCITSARGQKAAWLVPDLKRLGQRTCVKGVDEVEQGLWKRRVDTVFTQSQEQECPSPWLPDFHGSLSHWWP